MRKLPRSKLSAGTQQLLLRLFCAGVTARGAALAAGVNRNTSTRFFRIFRRRIALARAALAPLVGECAADECYLRGGPGGRKAARRGRSLAGKFAVAGVAQRDAETGVRRVRMARIDRVDEGTLAGFVRAGVAAGATVHTDSLASYRLAPLGYRHLRVNHSVKFKDRRTGACTNVIESCWALLKRHLCRFCGGWRHNLDLWLREVEMRWECGGARFFAELDRLFA